MKFFISKTVYTNKTGRTNRHWYTLWKSDGDTCMTVRRNGKFSCCWGNVDNALFKTGYYVKRRQLDYEKNSIYMDYRADYRPDSDSYLAVYGWTQKPLIEYYIVESWGKYRPEKQDWYGTESIDGGEYDIYTSVRQNAPSIEGTKDFLQFWSVRREKGHEGHIDVSGHFAAWKKYGLEMGSLNEVTLAVEAMGDGSGEADVQMNRITIE